MTLTGFFAVMLALDALFGQSYSIRSARGVSREYFERVTLGSLTVMIALGLMFWAVGERKRQAGLLGIAMPTGRPPDGGRGGDGRP